MLHVDNRRFGRLLFSATGLSDTLGPHPSPLKMKVTCFSETLLSTYETTRRQNPEQLPIRKPECLHGCLLFCVQKVLFPVANPCFRQRCNLAVTQRQCVKHTSDPDVFRTSRSLLATVVQSTCRALCKGIALHADAWGPNVPKKLVVFQVLLKTTCVRNLRFCVAVCFINVNGLFQATYSYWTTLKEEAAWWHAPSKRR